MMKPKKIAVTGCHGRLGNELVTNWGCIPLECNITNGVEIASAIRKVKPDVVIHCAAITDVDLCEKSPHLHKAYQVNVGGLCNLRERFNGQVVLMSTDYIFNGKYGSYVEVVEPDPINHYGITKYKAEKRLREYAYARDVIVRTTILYGSPVKPDFVTSILNRLEKGEPFEVTKSLVGTPTYVPHLAEALIRLINLDGKLPKVINVAGKDLLSRYEFALMIASVWGYNKELISPTVKVFGDAKRPKHAGLKTVLAEKYKLPIYTVLEGLQAMKDANTWKKTPPYQLSFLTSINGT